MVYFQDADWEHQKSKTNNISIILININNSYLIQLHNDQSSE